MYSLLTGRVPCEGKSLVETLQKIRTEEPAKPKKFQMSIPDVFQGIVLKMLAKRPEERHQTAKHLMLDLEKVLKYQGVQDESRVATRCQRSDAALEDRNRMVYVKNIEMVDDAMVAILRKKSEAERLRIAWQMWCLIGEHADKPGACRAS